MQKASRRPWNKVDLDGAALLKRFVAGETSDALAAEFGTSQLVVLRHLKEVAGPRYDKFVAAHWKALGPKRAEARAGGRTKGGRRWFNAAEEDEVVDYYSSGKFTLQQVADRFGCSRVVVKRLLARRLPPEVRRAKAAKLAHGRVLKPRVSLECPTCKKAFEVVPWKARQGLRFCSRACMGRAKSGEACHLYGKPSRGRGRWYEMPGGGRAWMRSDWEFGVALYLNSIGEPWQYEARTFEITLPKGKATYTPDFLLTRTGELIEVKGRWRAPSIEKHEALLTQYPNEKVSIWDEAKLIGLGIINRKGYLVGPYAGARDVTLPALPLNLRPPASP